MLTQLQTQPVHGVFKSMVKTGLFVALLATATMTPVLAATAATEQQAIQIALQQSGGSGKVLSVKSETGKDGKGVFLIKVLTDGRVRVVRVNRSQ